MKKPKKLKKEHNVLDSHYEKINLLMQKVSEKKGSELYLKKRKRKNVLKNLEYLLILECNL